MSEPTAMVPLPAASSSRLGLGAAAGAASADGTKLHEACAFFAGAGLSDATNFCNSITLSLSAANAKVRRGAWKLVTLRFPVMLLDPTAPLMLLRLSEF